MWENKQCKSFRMYWSYNDANVKQVYIVIGQHI